MPASISGRRRADILLLGVTAVELALLPVLTPTFTLADWIYCLDSLLVLGIALTRQPPKAQDRTIGSSLAVAGAYAYPYAQVAYLRWAPGDAAWPGGGLALVTLAACLNLASLVTLGRWFGIRPALRGAATTGPYRLVRHPMYLAYMLADLGYNLQECNLGTVLLVVAGWTCLIYRIHAEERILSSDPSWPRYVAAIRYRLVPWLW